VYVIEAVYQLDKPGEFRDFTGTVAESIIIRALGDSSLHEARTKPFSASPIFALDGRGVWRPVLGYWRCSPPCNIKLRVGVVGEDLAMKLVDGLSTISLFGENRLEATDMEIRRVEPRPETTAFRIRFLSPTRFSIAPVPPYRRRQPKFEFAPYPLRLFKSIIRHGRELGIWGLGTRFLAWVHTYVYMEDLGCWGRSCVVTVRLSRGRLARGFTGWAIYTVRNCRRLRSLWAALRVAEALNVGSGKSMGLGTIVVDPLQPRKNYCSGGGGGEVRPSGNGQGGGEGQH